jgi:glycosyltransferase involved in cell wall biosynthesis
MAHSRRAGASPRRGRQGPPTAAARVEPPGPRLLLSACLIVKNEARYLDACLCSLTGLVDEVVVVDTGSNDTSKRIARKHGARVFDFEWIDDFAAARNHAVDRARGEWILYIDADERVRPASAARLRQQLSSPTHVGYYVLLHSRPRFTPYWEMRLFRNDPRVRFRGVIHENIWPALAEYRAAHKGRIGRSELVLDHEGYEGDQSAKHRRNLPLLKRRLRADPTAVYSWCHLAGIYVATAKPRLAERAWSRALAVVRAKPYRQPEDCLPYVGLIEWGARRGRAVEALLEEALVKFPGNLYLQYLRGTALMRAGRFAEAIPVFEHMRLSGETGKYDHSFAYDVRLLDLIPYESLAACHFKLGHYGESRRYFERAAARDPGKLEYRVKQALCARLEPGSRLARGGR